MNKQDDFNPDDLPNFVIPKELKRLLEESSHNSSYIAFLRTKNGVIPIMNFESGIDQCGMIQWITSYSLATLQAHSENIARQTYENLGGGEIEEE